MLRDETLRDKVEPKVRDSSLSTVGEGNGWLVFILFFHDMDQYR